MNQLYANIKKYYASMPEVTHNVTKYVGTSKSALIAEESRLKTLYDNKMEAFLNVKRLERKYNVHSDTSFSQSSTSFLKDSLKTVKWDYLNQLAKANHKYYIPFSFKDATDEKMDKKIKEINDKKQFYPQIIVNGITFSADGFNEYKVDRLIPNFPYIVNKWNFGFVIGSLALKCDFVSSYQSKNDKLQLLLCDFGLPTKGGFEEADPSVETIESHGFRDNDQYEVRGFTVSKIRKVSMTNKYGITLDSNDTTANMIAHANSNASSSVIICAYSGMDDMDAIFQRSKHQHIKDAIKSNCIFELLKMHVTDEFYDRLLKKFKIITKSTVRTNAKLLDLDEEDEQPIYEEVEQDDGNIPIEYKDIDALATSARLAIKIYTDYSAFLGKDAYYERVGHKKGTVISIRISDSHATLYFEMTGKIDAVKYVDEATLRNMNKYALNVVKPYKSDVVNDASSCGDVHALAVREDNQVVIYKTYRPSETLPMVEKVDSIDTYYRCFTPESTLFHHIVGKYYIRKCDNIYSADIKASMHFMNTYASKKANVASIDRNKSYVCGTKSEYYRGYPNLRYMTKLNYNDETDLPVAFVQVVAITDAVFPHWLNWVPNAGILPEPLFRRLSKYYTPTHKYCCEFTRIDFLNEALQANLTPLKRVNTVLGKFIQGGLDDGTEEYNLGVYGEHATARMKHQADKAKKYLNVMPLGNGKYNVTAQRDKRPQYEHIYSYVLGYHSIAMIDAMEHLEKYTPIIGYKVDAIHIAESGLKYAEVLLADEYGAFKYEKQTVTEVTPVFKQDYVSKSEVSLFTHRFKVIEAPAGIGKTYKYLSMNEKDELMTTFTHARLEQLNYKLKATCHSAFNLNHSNKPMTKYRAYFVDEYTLLSQGQCDEIVDLCKDDGAFLIFAGDSYQASNMADTKRKHFPTATYEHLERSKDGKHRHEYEYGMFLDGIRKLSTEDMLGKLSCFEHTTLNKVDIPIEVRQGAVFITGNHKTKVTINNHLKHEPTIPVRVITAHKRDGKQYHVGITMNIDQAKNINDIEYNKDSIEYRTSKKYEPMGSLIVDGMQGLTWEHKTYILASSLTRRGTLYTH